MTGHTKEPWVRVDRADYAEILPADGSSAPVIAMVGRAQDVDRINACVNPLAGIENPAAFVQAARGMEDAMADWLFYLEGDGDEGFDHEPALLLEMRTALTAFRAATG